MKHFSQAICIKEGIYNGIEFKIGDIYAITGNNNATQLAYADKYGDTQILMLHNYSNNTMYEWSVDDSDITSGYPVFTFLED